jgi:large subunit ribosomal protein L6
MSRVGKNPVTVPNGVEVSLVSGMLKAKGKLGEQSVTILPEIEVKIADSEIVVSPKDTSKRALAMWGTTRSLVNNAVSGVSVGFVMRLEVNGVGYRAQAQGSKLTLQLGYSHDINYVVPEGIKVAVEGDRNNVIAVSGVDKQKVGQVASEIRAFRKPEPYKGKGVRYSDEYIVRKEGKKK